MKKKDGCRTSREMARRESQGSKKAARRAAFLEREKERAHTMNLRSLSPQQKMELASKGEVSLAKLMGIGRFNDQN